jgi:hypothetical protein
MPASALIPLYIQTARKAEGNAENRTGDISPSAATAYQRRRPMCFRATNEPEARRPARGLLVIVRQCLGRFVLARFPQERFPARPPAHLHLRVRTSGLPRSVPPNRGVSRRRPWSPDARRIVFVRRMSPRDPRAARLSSSSTHTAAGCAGSRRGSCTPATAQLVARWRACPVCQQRERHVPELEAVHRRFGRTGLKQIARSAHKALVLRRLLTGRHLDHLRHCRAQKAKPTPRDASGWIGAVASHTHAAR